MEETRFTYVVNPRRPIKGIQDMPAIKSSKTLKLTKDEALQCMKCGPVYRKFANEGIQERVTTTTIDRLHNEKFMSEVEFSGSNIVSVPSTEQDDTVETTEAVITEEEPKVEEVIATDAVEDSIEETAVVNDNNDNTLVEEKRKEKEDEVAQDVEEESEDTVENTDTDNIMEEISDSEVKDEDNSDELQEVNDNSQRDKNITVNYNNNKGRKKKKHRN